MIVALPMYDRPEVAAVHDRLCQLFVEAYGDGPQRRTDPKDLWALWQNPELLLSQTCGYPLRRYLKGKVALIGAPDHGISEVPAGHYCSVIVTHTSHIAAQIAAQSDNPIAALDGARMAYNEALSQSGWAAPWQHFKQASVRIGPRLQSGSHRISAQMVARGDADFAALDVISWKLMQRHDAFASALVAVAQTAPTPALPFISAAYRDVSPIFFALDKAIAALSPSEQAELMLKGLVNIAQSSYDAVPNPPSP
ncbi:PhnD/SsuA/transferrin family substrate-binding protein [Shimia sp. R10_1]|uniref:phosphate/phosphite/phosphonate ABC transporter substrate-binding protein n=1 Tax=Shimia sp. R10_1 TaxID=2821095 RepID=UPI001AD9A9E4|nr:PhnD/SsuA/transferrin family substrate-binding protein [Shimia sp. R10_1]MBO9472433.1 PhnD/SsuA/transferrin family substrate-binding protein [Shimia sp. R10_1]